ncbi:hypothetical protein [Streptomyces sp. ECR3.8]|uniref:hypothetical protein n=1 Tax=Streptomyces sp. ECR3.8 TaxID=3461009 RepID=UPI004043718D
MNTPQNRRLAMELTLHRLTNHNPGDVYDEITRLCIPGGVENLMAIAVHLADAMAAVLVKDTGSREAAVAALRKQLGTPEPTALRSVK